MHDVITIEIDGTLYVRHNGELRPVPRGGADDETPPANGEPTPDQGDQGRDGAPAPDAGDGAPAGGEGGDASASTDDATGAIPDLPTNIESVEEPALRELWAQLEDARVARRESAQTIAQLDELDGIVARQNAIAAEITRRREEAQQVAQRLSDESSLPTALPDAQAEPVMAGAGASAATLAAARGPQSSSEQQPPAPRPERSRVAMVAAAGADNVPAGAEMDWAHYGEMVDKVKRKPGADTILASIPAFMPGETGIPEPLSKDNGAMRNQALIDEAVADWRARQRGERPARTAAICEPFDIIREIPDAFSTAEPVRGVFPARPAGRLGFQYVRSIGLADVAGGAGMWFEADQAAVDEDDSATWKPCIEVDCPDILTAEAEAVTACLTYPITTEMSAPERVRNFTNALMAWKARVKEGRILNRIDQLSINWRFFGDYGALPAVVEALNSVLAQLEFQDRQNESNYVLIVPPGVAELLTIDRANRGYNNDATDDVMTYLRSNVEGLGGVVESMDNSLGGEPGVPFNALPVPDDPVVPVTFPYLSGRTFRFRLVEPTAAIYAETGEMNMGVTRDSRLIRMNKSQLFVEEYFFLAKHGPQPWATIDVELCADGSRAGLVAPHGCTQS